MTTVTQLRTPMSRRNRPTQATVREEFREDVIAYGALLYDSLRQRQDFDVLKDHDIRKKVCRTGSN